jgi:isoleucyl-tRNA synthetase
MTVPSLGKFVDFESILIDELNVKKVVVGDEFELDLELPPELKREGLMREVVRTVQNARKSAGLNVDDRIKLGLTSDGKELSQAIEEYRDEIMRETLAVELTNGEFAYSEESKVGGESLKLSLEKA